MSTQIREMVQTCPECVKSSTPPWELMNSSTLPEHPWQKVASDLFQLHGNTYLLVVDYFSQYPEVVKLTTTSLNPSSPFFIIMESQMSLLVTMVHSTAPKNSKILPNDMDSATQPAVRITHKGTV